MNSFLCTLMYIVMMLLGMLVVKYQLICYAQTPRPELEKLTKDIVEPFLAQMSPDGKFVVLSEINENSEVSLTISETQKPFRKIRRPSGAKYFFLGNDVLVLFSGNVLQKINLKTFDESEIQNVKAIDFIEDEKLLLVHYDDSKDNVLEIYDQRFIIKQKIESVLRWKKTEGEVIVFKSEGSKKKLLKISSDGVSNKVIWLSGEDIYNVFKSESAEGGYVVSLTGTSGLKTYYVKPDLSTVELNNTSIGSYDQIAVKQSSDVNAIFLTLSKTLPLDNKTVSIWYGQENDLSNYFYGERPSIDILWYPEEQRVVELDTDYIGYTGLGKSNMFLRRKMDHKMIDKNDIIYRDHLAEIYLWNFSTGKEIQLGEDGGKMYFDKKGNYILRFAEAGWKLFDTRTMEDRMLNIPKTAVPHFSAETILWSLKGELIEQDLKDFQKKRIFSSNADSIEILNTVKKSTEVGIHRKYYYLDDHFVLLATHNKNDLKSTYYKIEAGKKQVVIPETTDRVKFLQTNKDGNKFVWIEENYNKTPIVMAKQRHSVSNLVHLYNTQDTTAKGISKRQLYYKGVNNEDLQASLFIPADFDPQKKYPVVLWIYEKQQEFTDKYLVPTFKNTRGFNARLLLESGYIVLMPDINYGIQGAGLSALFCINNVLDELSKVEQVDMKRLALMGQSFGGYETNFIATHSDRFAAYISGAGVSDIINHSNSFNHNFKSPDYYRVENGQYRMSERFEDNKQKYFNNNPLYHTSKVNAPILLWSGTEDKNVDQEESRTFFTALRKYRKTAVALFYNGEGHSLTKYDAQRDLTLRVLDWYDYFLKEKRNIPWIDKQMKDAD